MDMSTVAIVHDETRTGKDGGRRELSAAQTFASVRDARVC